MIISVKRKKRENNTSDLNGGNWKSIFKKLNNSKKGNSTENYLPWFPFSCRYTLFCGPVLVLLVTS